MQLAFCSKLTMYSKRPRRAAEGARVFRMI